MDGKNIKHAGKFDLNDPKSYLAICQNSSNFPYHYFQKLCEEWKDIVLQKFHKNKFNSRLEDYEINSNHISVEIICPNMDAIL